MTTDVHDRPVNTDGTTNWQVVFDDLDRGVLAAVRAVSSVAQLRTLLDSVAVLLFKRRHDAETRASFRQEMDRIIREHDGDLEFIRADILVRLCNERDERIRKAAQYAENKSASQSLERRRRGISPTVLKKPAVMIAAAAALAAIAAAVVFQTVDFADRQDTVEAGAPEPAKTAPEQVRKEPEQPKPAPPPPVAVEKMLAMKPMPLSVNISGRASRQAYVPLIRIGKDPDISALCALSPWITEGVTLHMHALTASGADATASAMQSVADKVRREINAMDKAELPPLRLVNSRDLARSVVSAAHMGCAQVEVAKSP